MLQEAEVAAGQGTQQNQNPLPLQKEMASAAWAEAEAKVQGSPAVPAGLKAPGELHNGAGLLCSTRADTSRDT